MIASDLAALYPDCEKDVPACIERYVRDRLEHMKSLKLERLPVGEFTETYWTTFKKIAAEYEIEGEYTFFWNSVGRNIGTVKDNYNYITMLYLIKK